MKNYEFKINGHEYAAEVISLDKAAGKASVRVNGIDYDVEMPVEEAPAPVIARPASPAAPSAPTPAAHAPAAVSSASAIQSPLPGVILGVYVNIGDTVKRGQRLIVLEAMKMENEILSEKDGSVKAIYVQKGDSVLEGAALIEIA